MEDIDCLVIGAGVVGLACAAALAQAGREVLMLEAEGAFGQGISSRSSEVIHAGLYYPVGSQRARLCVRGRQLLYAFCERHGVAHRRCGKLVVAQDEAEVAQLARVQAQALANGVDDVRWLSAAQAQALEPALRCQAALHSPATGIVDSHGLMLALLGLAEQHGATLVLRSPVLGGQPLADGRVQVSVGSPSAPGVPGAPGAPAEPALVLRARSVINAAGLNACAVALALGTPATQVPTPRYAQGAYFSLSGARAPFRHLIYPVPGQSSHLGVHLTLDLGGQARFGPSFRWVDAPDYRVLPDDGAGFEAAVRHYWPGLPAHALVPAYAGVRPKISGPGEAAADFRLDGPAQHGVPGLVNLLGIESPGLTASLALAEAVSRQLLAG